MTLPLVSVILFSVMAINSYTIKEAEAAVAVLREQSKTFERYADDVSTYNAAVEAFKVKEAQYKNETGGDLSKATEPVDTKRKELFYDVKAIDRDDVALNDAVDGFYKECLRLWSNGIPSDPREKSSGRKANLTDWDDDGIMQKHLLTGYTAGLKGLSDYASLEDIKKAAIKSIKEEDLEASIPSFKPTYRRDGKDIKSRSPRKRTEDGSNYYFNQMNNVMVSKKLLLRKNTNEGRVDAKGNKLRGAKFEYKLA